MIFLKYVLVQSISMIYEITYISVKMNNVWKKQGIMSGFQHYICLKTWIKFSLLYWYIIYLNHENVEIFFSVGRFSAQGDDIWFLVVTLNTRYPMYNMIWHLKYIISILFWFCLFGGCSCSTVPRWRCPCNHSSFCTFWLRSVCFFAGRLSNRHG